MNISGHGFRRSSAKFFFASVRESNAASMQTTSSHRFVKFQSCAAHPLPSVTYHIMLGLERCAIWGVGMVLPMRDPRSEGSRSDG